MVEAFLDRCPWPVPFILKVGKPRPGVTHELGQSQEEQRRLGHEKRGRQPSLAPCWSWLGGRWRCQWRGGGPRPEGPFSASPYRVVAVAQPCVGGCGQGGESAGRVDGWAGFPLPAQWARPASLVCRPEGGWRREVWRLLLSQAVCAAALALITPDLARDQPALPRACPGTSPVPRNQGVCVCSRTL